MPATAKNTTESQRTRTGQTLAAMPWRTTRAPRGGLLHASTGKAPLPSALDMQTATFQLRKSHVADVGAEFDVLYQKKTAKDTSWAYFSNAKPRESLPRTQTHPQVGPAACDSTTGPREPGPAPGSAALIIIPPTPHPCRPGTPSAPLFRVFTAPGTDAGQTRSGAALR